MNRGEMGRARFRSGRARLRPSRGTRLSLAAGTCMENKFQYPTKKPGLPQSCLCSCSSRYRSLNVASRIRVIQPAAATPRTSTITSTRTNGGTRANPGLSSPLGEDGPYTYPFGPISLDLSGLSTFPQHSGNGFYCRSITRK
jgi:hypothetical protein